jgi:hypothetical protein
MVFCAKGRSKGRGECGKVKGLGRVVAWGRKLVVGV